MSSFWRGLARFEHEKVAPGIALRNALGVAIPLLAGFLSGHTNSGLVGTTGALNVSFMDGRDPYRPRSERMLAASVLCGSAVFMGALVGDHHVIAVLVTLCWAFAAGLLVAADQAAADVGTISLVTLVVFAAHSLPPDQAVSSGLIACVGGLLQTSLALAMWPIRRFEPEQRALANLYTELGRAASAPVQAQIAPPATNQTTEAHKTLTSLRMVRNVQAERYLLLLAEAERIRLSLLFLGRLRIRLQRQSEELGTEIPVSLDEYTAIVGTVLSDVGRTLEAGEDPHDSGDFLGQLSQIGEEIRQTEAASQPAIAATLSEIIHQVEALTGQTRAAVELATSATLTGRMAFEKREKRRPIHLRLISTWPTLRANLTLRSAACRHALRLGLCVGLAEAVSRAFGFERGYWIPMTVAIILKPDFTATFSRGLQRLLGTVAGLVIATALFHVLPTSFATEFTLVTVFAFLLRCFGPANYGILTTAVSALVVALLAVIGMAPSETVAARAIATLTGGVLALVAYAVWPTWEESQLPEMMARMLDAYRAYFHVIRDAFLQPDRDFGIALDAARHRARLDRTNLEASMERLEAEPGVDHGEVRRCHAAVAASHRMIHAVMAMEAALTRSKAVPARDAFRVFAHDVEVTLHSLSSALRGTDVDVEELPDLREDYHALVSSGGRTEAERYALVNVESDRITNSLNTLTRELASLIPDRLRHPHQTSPGAR